MKLFNKQAMALLVCVITINILCVTSVSYAYFTANIVGNEDAEEMVVHAGTMEITYTDSNGVNLTSAIPGDSVTKKFKVKNTGSLNTKYNVKLNISNNTFVKNSDLLVSLKKKTDGGSFVDVFSPEQPLPVTTGPGYIAVDQDILSGATDIYELTIKFKNDTENQNPSAEEKLVLTVDVDNVQNAESLIN